MIASGPIPPNPAELLITDRFRELLGQVRGQYDTIILDTPPVGLVSESLDLLQLADICLFVVRYNYSQKQFIEHINTLKKQQILNKAYLVFNGVEKRPIAMAMVTVTDTVTATTPKITKRSNLGKGG